MLSMLQVRRILIQGSRRNSGCAQTVPMLATSMVFVASHRQIDMVFVHGVHQARAPLSPRESCYSCENLPRFFGLNAPFGAGWLGRPTARAPSAGSAGLNASELVACLVIGNINSGW